MPYPHRFLLPLAVLALSACSTADQPAAGDLRPALVGGLALQWTLPDKVELSSVDYALSDGREVTRSGSFPLEQAASGRAGYRAPLDNLPASAGYTLTLDGRAQGLTCHGEASFDVIANTSTSVTLHMRCRSDDASALTETAVESCPMLDGLVASPAADSGSIALRALGAADATDAYQWQASAGSLSGTDASATLDCPSAGGEVSVALRVQRDARCGDEATIDVICPVDWAHVDPVRPLYGVTIDDVAAVDRIVPALQRLARRPIARVVFDPDRGAGDYVEAVARIHAVSGVMGELVDSHAIAQVSESEYASRTQAYLTALGDDVDVWEVGNEVNGEWLGTSASVVHKIKLAYDLVHAAHKATALTLYYNAGCWEQSDHELFRWVAEQLPNELKQGLDYVLLSFYEEQCPHAHPDWNRVFAQLAEAFPNSRLGFGECGTTVTGNKASLIEHYYSLRLALPQYVGGYFWWYFLQDMLPTGSRLWNVLNTTLERQP